MLFIKKPLGLARGIHSLSSTMTGGNSYVKRLTFFKVPKQADIDKVLKEYETLRKSAMKVEDIFL